MVKSNGLSIWPIILAASAGLAMSAQAQEPLPWRSDQNSVRADQGQPNYRGDYQATQPRAYQAPVQPYQQAQGAPNNPAPDPYRPNGPGAAPADAYRGGERRDDAYSPPRTYPPSQRYPQTNRTPNYGAAPAPRYIQPYQPPAQRKAYPRYGANEPYRQDYGDRGGYRDGGSPRMPGNSNTTYSENEVIDAGHRFFGSVTKGLAKAVQWAFKRSGRPNGYILGEDAGGAFIAGLRYGEGRLYTKHAGVHRVFWQGPSIGYDFGGDGNRTMTLVYNLRGPSDVYRRFAGVQGAAYLVGGVSVQLLTADEVTLAPIRTGVGLRLGANIGYLKDTRRPTWNPF